VTTCATITTIATGGVAPALRAVDCLANEATSTAFGRLFGTNGALLPALTIILTLYIAFFAISLLTGRSTLGVAALTPRMLTLGLVLTFATSSVAYQSVVWNLAVGAPDQIAGILMGTKGQATQIFANRIDAIFNAITEVASSVNNTAAGAAQQAGTFTPANLMWLAALMLMLATVGVLVTARIALAVLLAVGPVFVVLALFNGTRGLFVGWLRAVVLAAITPLFAVLGGGFMLELAVPVIRGLRNAEGIDSRAVMALFLIAAVHVALMTMVLQVVGTMLAGWRVFGLLDSDTRTRGNESGLGTSASVSMPAPQKVTVSASRRMAAAAAVVTPSVDPPTIGSAALTQFRDGRAVPQTSGGLSPPHVFERTRARGIGSRFRAAPKLYREMIR
jgi:type IV secretion system protein VirB6